MSFRRSIMLLAVLVVFAAVPAFATVTFDPNTGTGFVGKGDVQTVFGWNNGELQRNAGGVSFEYNVSEVYECVCSWTTGEGTHGEQTHFVNHTKDLSIDAGVSYDARTRRQITGFILTGYGSVLGERGEVPVVGGPCPGNQGTGGTWVSVTLVESGGGLYVIYNGVGVLIY